MENNNLEDKFIAQFKKQIKFLKDTIVSLVKKEKALLSKIKSTNDKELIKELKETRIELELCRKALDDLTYSYILEFSSYSENLVRKLHYQTTDEYLARNYEEDRPSMVRMIDVISRIDTENLNNNAPLSTRIKPLKELYIVDYDEKNNFSSERKKIEVDKTREHREENIFALENAYRSSEYNDIISNTIKHK